MAYQIDFTASNWANRSRRKAFLRLSLLAAVVGAAYGVYDVYTTYNEPTLNMRLAEYEAVARPVEDMNKVWDETSKEFNAILRYYRLVWAANPTNFLNTMASTNAPQLERGFHPDSWTLKTGGECTLKYRYVFGSSDKAAQAKVLETNIVNAVTSVVQIASNTEVDVQGVQHENLLNVKELNISVRFSLANTRSFPAKESALPECVSEIADMRKKVHDKKIATKKNGKVDASAVRMLMVEYNKTVVGVDKEELPAVTNINIAGFFEAVDRLVKKCEEESKKEMPGKNERHDLRAAWDAIGEARWPWNRVRDLDNDALVNRTKELGKVADGVKRFKGFLEQRNADCKKKLEPFINAYDRNDVFNEPLIESDLKDRVAKAADIASVGVTFNDEPNVEPAVLYKDDEKFTFTWVHWTLSINGEWETGNGESSSAKATEDKRETGNGESSSAKATEDKRGTGKDGTLTLERLADCVRRVLELGPGYVLDTVKVNFGEDGSVSGAVLDGLLPVKKSESTKEAADNVD